MLQGVREDTANDAEEQCSIFIQLLNTKSKLPTGLIQDVIQVTMDPILVNAIADCKWDEETMVLSMPEDGETEKMKEMEEAAWYRDEFGDHMMDTNKKEKK